MQNVSCLYKLILLRHYYLLSAQDTRVTSNIPKPTFATFFLFIFLFDSLAIDRKIDLLYLIDVSKLTSPSNLQDIKDFIKKDLPAYRLSSLNGSRVSVIIFDSNARTVLSFDEGISRNNVLNALETIEVQDRSVDLNQGFGLVVSQLSNFRADATKMIVLFTTSSSNGVQSTKLMKNIGKIKNNDVNIIVVGIGKGVNPTDLAKLTTNPSGVIVVKLPLSIDDHVSKINILIAKSTGNLKILKMFVDSSGINSMSLITCTIINYIAHVIM